MDQTNNKHVEAVTLRIDEKTKWSERGPVVGSLLDGPGGGSVCMTYTLQTADLRQCNAGLVE